MQLITIDKEKCVKCQRCAVICPMRVISMEKGHFPAPTKNAYALCINCGYCVDVCVFDALFHQVRTTRTSDSSAALLRYETIVKKKGEPFQEG